MQIIMMDDLDLFAPTPAVSTHGGARQGAGRKPPGYKKAAEQIEFDKARARNEAAKAELNELKVKVELGQYLPKAMVVQLVTTAYATLAQSMRSIPDDLERKIGLDPTACESIANYIDAALGDIAERFEKLAGGGNDDISAA